MLYPYEDGKMIIKTLIIGIFVLSIVGYAIYQSQGLVRGPQIAITYPVSGQEVADDLIVVSGNAKNIASITMNDRTIYVDESGVFQEKLMLYPGYNIIKIRAEDKFGSTVDKYVEVIH
jgi:hypothetical protein